MKVLIGAIEFNFTPMPCIQIQVSVYSLKTMKQYSTKKLNKISVISQKSLINIQSLRIMFRDPDSCVVTNIRACALMTATSNLLAKHFFNNVLTQTEQSDEHLLASARAGWSRGCRQSSPECRVEVADPIDVPLINLAF